MVKSLPYPYVHSLEVILDLALFFISHDIFKPWQFFLRKSFLKIFLTQEILTSKKTLQITASRWPEYKVSMLCLQNTTQFITIYISDKYSLNRPLCFSTDPLIIPSPIASSCAQPKHFSRAALILLNGLPHSARFDPPFLSHSLPSDHLLPPPCFVTSPTYCYI